VESAKAAVSVAPFLPVTHVALAEAYFGANRSMAALDAAQDALRLAPDSAAAHFLVGRVSQRLGRKEAAAAAYEAALAIDPSHSAARNNLGVVAMSQGQTMAAASHFLGSVRADPAQQAAASNVMIGVGAFLAKLSRRTFGAFLVAVALWILAQTSLDNALLDRVVRPGFAVVTVAVVGWIAWRGARVLPRNLLRSLPRSGRPARVGALAVLTLVACVLVAVAPKATSDSVLVGIHLLFVAALIVNLRDRSRKVRRRR
jgi:tetratricopeptide (TPR) repeat protein